MAKNTGKKMGVPSGRADRRTAAPRSVKGSALTQSRAKGGSVGRKSVDSGIRQEVRNIAAKGLEKHKETWKELAKH